MFAKSSEKCLLIVSVVAIVLIDSCYSSTFITPPITHPGKHLKPFSFHIVFSHSSDFVTFSFQSWRMFGGYDSEFITWTLKMIRILRHFLSHVTYWYFQICIRKKANDVQEPNKNSSTSLRRNLDQIEWQKQSR